MATAGVLAQYMSIKSQISYYQLQDTRWNNLATAMSKKLSEQESAQDKWDDASDKCEDVYGDESKSLIYKGETYWNKGQKVRYDKATACTRYANAKVPKYDEDKLDEYSELDMEYSTMVTMYDTLLEELKAQEEGLKSTLSTEAQDTHIVSQ